MTTEGLLAAWAGGGGGGLWTSRCWNGWPYGGCVGQRSHHSRLVGSRC